jgi:hypothetical protein
MIGCARENITILANAVAYLQRDQHPEPQDVLEAISFVPRSQES